MLKSCLAPAKGNDSDFELRRRGYSIGYYSASILKQDMSTAKVRQSSEAAFFPQILKESLSGFKKHLVNSEKRYSRVIAGSLVEDILEEEGVLDRIADEFELLSASFDESDRQQLERLDFDVLPVEEELEVWLKVSQLSFSDSDNSIRFRFSFGMDGYEDVGSNPVVAAKAARLAGLCFPECDLVTGSASLRQKLSFHTDDNSLSFVERIIYFNAPDGGAQFHQDVEPGHYGIVYAQLTGSTGWIALPKQTLIERISQFVLNDENRSILVSYYADNEISTLTDICRSNDKISACLDDTGDELLDRLINQVAEFSALLVSDGYGYVLYPGDVLWLPQQDLDNCVWHSVFCIGDAAGQALSFAVRHCEA